MPIIAVTSPKGGSGKTTLSINIARAIQKRGFSVLLVDSDVQGSAGDWHTVRDEPLFPLVAIDRANNLKTLPSGASAYDYTIVDGAAKLEELVAATIKVADIILIPVQPSPFDLWAASDLVELIKTRQEITEGKPRAVFVINRSVKGTKLGQEVLEALEKHDLGLMATVIQQRQIYAQSASDGATVFETWNKEAINEIDALADELLSLLSES